MKRFKIAAALLVSVLAAPAVAEVELPLMAVIKSTKGSAATDAAKKFSIYFKSYVANDSVIVDYDDGRGPITVPIPKANYLTSLTNNVTNVILNKDTANIKVYAGKDIWFLNFQNDSVYQITPYEPLNQITEFRISGNKLTNLDIVNSMAKLNYLVCENNLLTTVDLKSNELERIQLGSQKYLNTVNVKGEKVWEFKLTSAPAEEINLLGCPLLREVNCSALPNLKDFKFDSKEITKFNLFNCPELEKIELGEQPKMISLSMTTNPKLADFTVPKSQVMTSISLFRSGMKSLDISGLGAVNTLQVYDCPNLESVNASNMAKLKTANLYNNPKLSSINLGGSTFTSLSLYNCNLSSLMIPEEAMNTCTSLQIYGNNFTLETLPVSPRNLNPAQYKYAPQKGFPKLEKKSQVGTTIDLAGWLKGYTLDGEVESVVKLISIFEEEMEEGVYWKREGSEFTFLKNDVDSVQYIVTNTGFPNFSGENTLTTGYTLVAKASGVTDLQQSTPSKGLNIAESGLVACGLKGEIYRIHDIAGRLVAEGVITEEEESILLPDNSVYIVTAGGMSRKVKLE